MLLSKTKKKKRKKPPRELKQRECGRLHPEIFEIRLEFEEIAGRTENQALSCAMLDLGVCVMRMDSFL